MAGIFPMQQVAHFVTYVGHLKSPSVLDRLKLRRVRDGGLGASVRSGAHFSSRQPCPQGRHRITSGRARGNPAEGNPRNTEHDGRQHNDAE
jgi:hypothetical protein